MIDTFSAQLLAMGGVVTAHATATEIDHHLPGRTGMDWRPTLLLREQPPQSGDRSHPVLYVHGATFPSALSVIFRFDGASWADSLNEKGFDAFGLDFAGYGGSERYPEMMGDTLGGGGVPGRAAAAADQIERAVRFIIARTGARQVSIIAHSWGTIAAGWFAATHPDLVDRLVLFGPIARRDGPPASAPSQPWDHVTIAQQHARFVKDVPASSAPVLGEHDFPRWAETYLASDPTSGSRTPPSVRVPAGPSADIAAAWSGHFPYDPSRITVPTLIIRGEWDSVSPDQDMAWLKGRLTGSPHVEDIKIPRATHLMHLEEARVALRAATNAFLTGVPALGTFYRSNTGTG